MNEYTRRHKEPTTRLIRVAVLVTADVRPKDISRLLDVAFEDVDEVLQFTVEGYAWENPEEPGDVTDKRLMAALADDTTERLSQ